jgi:uncharacterized protein (DUF2141 family)
MIGSQSRYQRRKPKVMLLPGQGEVGGHLRQQIGRRVRAFFSPRTLATNLLCVAITAFSATHAFAQQTPAAADARIEAAATNLRNSNGSFACSLYNSPQGFPKTDESVVGRSRVKIKDGQATCVFNNMKPGVYAVVAMHDENDNGKMDYNFLGIPTEGYGFSSGATATFGAPSFDAAKFQYNGGVLKIPIPLKY